MPTCPQCQNENADTASYCVFCGSPLNQQPASEPAPSAPPPAAQPQFPANPAPQPQYQYPAPPYPQGQYPPNQYPPTQYPPTQYPPPPPGYYYPPYPPYPPPAEPQSKSVLPGIGAVVLLIACFLPFFDLTRLITASSGSLISPEMLGISGETGTASVFQILIGILNSANMLLSGINYVPFYFYLPFIYLLTLISLPINGIIGLTAFAGTEKSTQRAKKAGQSAFWTTIVFWIGLLLIFLALGNLAEEYAPDFGTMFTIIFNMMGFGVLVALLGAGLQWLLK